MIILKKNIRGLACRVDSYLGPLFFTFPLYLHLLSWDFVVLLKALNFGPWDLLWPVDSQLQWCESVLSLGLRRPRRSPLLPVAPPPLSWGKCPLASQLIKGGC